MKNHTSLKSLLFFSSHLTHFIFSQLGDRILVNESKLGTLQFCGTVEFAGGTWAGVELDEPDGKNDGTVNGITYFTTEPGFGVMVPTNKIEKVWKEF